MTYVTLDQAKKLKALGFPQEGIEVDWVELPSGVTFLDPHTSPSKISSGWWSAPSVEELMEWLPWYSDKNEHQYKRMLHITKKDSCWRVTYGYNRGSKDHPDFWSENTTLINGLFQCACWVLE